MRLVAERAPSRGQFLGQVIQQVESDLKEAKIKAKVTGRPKHYYSIYQKMIVRGREFSDIYDLVGIRILVESDRDCYAALGVLHSRWNPVPGRFNIALFDNTLTDMQLQGGYVSTTSGPTTAIFNAGEGTSRGVEIESFFQPFETLSLSLSYSFLDTKLVKSADFCSRVEEVGFIEGFTCTPIAEAGDELPFAPDHTYIANLNWTLPLPEHWGRVELGGTYAYTGAQRVAATSSSPFAVLDAFGLLNLNLGWAGILATDYDLNVFATNVLDEEYVVFTSGTYRPLGIESRNVGAPRFIGARLRYNF